MTPDQAKRMQTRLGVIADGNPGRGTYAALFAKMGAPAARSIPLGLAAAAHFARFGISDTPLRLAHFLGQTSLESGNFQYMREIWGPTPAQAGYEGRADLGNTQPGDGKRYMGRAILQVTGRANYRRAAGKLGIDVEAEPELLERPDIGLIASCHWWQDNDANRWADRDDASALSRLVNRGSATSDKPANHEADRIVATIKAKGLIL
jgi:putative chitinase